MSFPNPDNYARDCDCGTAGANTTPPPATIQGEIDSLDTRVTALEETNDVIVSSGGIAALTTAQQALIREGSIVVTTDGKRWVYSGAGSKVLEASYIQLADITPVSPLIFENGGTITMTDNGGTSGAINISGFDGGAGGSITSIGGTGGGGGAINTSGGEDGAGGAINTSNNGGTINTSGASFSMGGSINLSNGGGSIISTGYAGGILGGTLDMSGGEGGAGGSIDTSAGIDGAGGSINVSNLGGSINTSNAGGSINTSELNGGSINTSGYVMGMPAHAGGSINTSGGVNGVGGAINTSNGGGSINTTSGGGSIDTTGQGSIGLGAGDIADSQTLITGTATVNRTATFPDNSGIIALVRKTSTSITFGVCAGNGAVTASTQFVEEAEVGDAVIVACTTNRATLTAGETSNIIFDGVVTDYEEVSVRAHNPHSNSITLGALNFKIIVFKL